MTFNQFISAYPWPPSLWAASAVGGSVYMRAVEQFYKDRVEMYDNLYGPRKEAPEPEQSPRIVFRWTLDNVTGGTS